ncbi:hypothetical protein O3Q51_16035 [Cryomorphaceae bacterium 1068]|nr:hypothetical protein [Cryomorphaceae bacterium 1068]
MKKLFLLILLFITADLFGQSVHTVEDPDITFSIEVPENWRVEDDGYTVALVPPQGGREYLDFTYYETTETDLEKAFEFTVLAFNGPKTFDTEIIDQGSDTVNGVRARWAILTLTTEGVPYHRLTYLLIKDGQYYIFQGTALPANFDYYRPIFEKVIRSLVTTSN